MLTRCRIRSANIGDEVWEQWIREVRMVEYVEEVCAELQGNTLGNRRVLKDGIVEFLEAGAFQRITPQGSKMSAASHAVALIRCARIDVRVPRARDCES